MTLSGSTGHHWVETVDRRFMMPPAMCSLLMFEACAKPPTEQIGSAEKAIKEVQANDASTYIPDEYAKIDGTLSALKEEVTHQDGKLALFRDYGEVWQLAVTAKSEAERLKTKGTEKKEETKTSALQVQQVAQEIVTAPVALVAKAPIGRGRAALESIKVDGEALKASLNQVRIAIDIADYPTAQTQAKAIHEKSQAVSREIETALAKIGERKPSAAKKK
jgi:hypothetical protein